MNKARKPQGIIALVDVALFSVVNDRLCVLVHQREHEPFAGAMALPGGYIQPVEDGSALEAARRVLLAKAGIQAPYLEQLATYSGPHRDPGGWSLSVAYYALVDRGDLSVEGDKGIWRPAREHLKLAFDHGEIVADALERIRNRSAYSILPAFLAGEKFTLPHLKRVYETVLGAEFDKASFRRRIEQMDALEPVKGEMLQGGATRPAQLYRIKPAVRSDVQSSNLMRGLAGR